MSEAREIILMLEVIGIKAIDIMKYDSNMIQINICQGCRRLTRSLNHNERASREWDRTDKRAFAVCKESKTSSCRSYSA